MKDEEDYAEPSPIQIRVYENKLEIINGGVLVRLRHGDAVLSALSRFARMTDSPHRSSAMMLQVYRQRSSLNTRKGLRPRNDPKERPKSDQNKQEDSIIELLKENPYISRKEISGRLGLHESSVKRRLVSLQEKGMIKHVGPNKDGHWEVQQGF